ncbi:uncharacterized protein LOC113374199, partial [Ctenocephalides felis]|uniref:uncharacterized protein LOC113374199 n=1 Tax=Ctenocephalides felis TaxID=7515 RepID=UPI000E6E27D0
STDDASWGDGRGNSRGGVENNRGGIENNRGGIENNRVGRGNNGVGRGNNGVGRGNNGGSRGNNGGGRGNNGGGRVKQRGGRGNYRADNRGGRGSNHGGQRNHRGGQDGNDRIGTPIPMSIQLTLTGRTNKKQLITSMLRKCMSKDLTTLFSSVGRKEAAISRKKDICSKYCIFMFDEISLSSDLSYHQEKDHSDHIIEFEQHANGRKLLLADHARVFMLKQIKDRWKQPVALYFSVGGVNSSDLKSLIVDISRKIFSIDLKI